MTAFSSPYGLGTSPFASLPTTLPAPAPSPPAPSPAGSLGPLDATLLETTRENLHIDFVEQGAPLVITFGFYFETGNPNFEFLGRLRKLESMSGRPLNKVLVRDPSMRWYLGGIEGLGDDVPETARALREVVERLQPSSVITVGQSMGAYAAVLYGTIIGADKAVAFGPLSCFDRRKWELIGDHRWHAVLEKLEASDLDFSTWSDLPALLTAVGDDAPDIDLVFGSAPNEQGASGLAIGHDAAHAIRFADLPTVTLLPVANSVHAVVEHFRSQGVITEVLEHRLFGTSLLPTIERLHGDQWVAWLLENVVEGVPYDQLRPIMLGQSCTAAQVDAYVRTAGLITDLARMQDTPPRRTV